MICIMSCTTGNGGSILAKPPSKLTLIDGTGVGAFEGGGTTSKIAYGYIVGCRYMLRGKKVLKNKMPKIKRRNHDSLFLPLLMNSSLENLMDAWMDWKLAVKEQVKRG